MYVCINVHTLIKERMCERNACLCECWFSEDNQFIQMCFFRVCLKLSDVIEAVQVRPLYMQKL